MESLALLKHKFDITDKDGNKLWLNEGGGFMLRLKGERSERAIGRLIYKDDPKIINQINLIYVKQDKESQVFRKLNAWSIHSHILTRVHGVEIHSEYGVYKITTEYAFTVGQYLHFQSSGIELKYYIPKTSFYFKSKNSNND
jgi:hypothetical protein